MRGAATTNDIVPRRPPPSPPTPSSPHIRLPRTCKADRDGDVGQVLGGHGGHRDGRAARKQGGGEGKGDGQHLQRWAHTQPWRATIRLPPVVPGKGHFAKMCYNHSMGTRRERGRGRRAGHNTGRVRVCEMTTWHKGQLQYGRLPEGNDHPSPTHSPTRHAHKTLVTA
jgi:hypothetical protein